MRYDSRGTRRGTHLFRLSVPTVIVYFFVCRRVVRLAVVREKSPRGKLTDKKYFFNITP